MEALIDTEECSEEECKGMSNEEWPTTSPKG